MSNQESLVSLISQKLESADLELPVFDDIAVRLHKGARENSLDAEEMCSLLEEDPALVSEVLRMSNSSFFSGLTEIRSLKDAAVRLGTKQVAAIVFSVSQKRLYSQSKGLFKGRLLELWQHANAVSSGARWVANTIGYRSISDEAFIAGLLHDVGKLSLLSIIEDLIASKELSLSDEIIDMTLNELYCEHGAKLLELWNLPEFFQQVVLHQADEEYDDSNIVLGIIRLVNMACILEGIADVKDTSGLILETAPEVQTLGLSEIDIAELRIMLEDFKAEKQQAA